MSQRSGRAFRLFFVLITAPHGPAARARQPLLNGRVPGVGPRLFGGAATAVFPREKGGDAGVMFRRIRRVFFAHPVLGVAVKH